ncbi:MAG: CBS domain-containing protein [Actinobacteria bacterium]|nr:CBS domain-containing protein [Actinomycetota bacterium]
MSDTDVQEVMTHLVVMLFPSESVAAVAERLSRNAIGGAPVVEGGKVVGMVSASDIVRVARRRKDHELSTETVMDVMTRPVVTVAPATSVWEAADILDRRGIKRLPVVDPDGYLVGIISRGDIVRLVAKAERPRRPMAASPMLPAGI